MIYRFLMWRESLRIIPCLRLLRRSVLLGLLWNIFSGDINFLFFCYWLNAFRYRPIWARNMMHAVFYLALCHNASIRSYHEIFKSEPLHFTSFWLAKYTGSSLLLVSFIPGWPGLLASLSFSAMGWTSLTCWLCSPTTWSRAWPTWRPGPGRISRQTECYRVSWWIMSLTGQYYIQTLEERVHAMN